LKISASPAMVRDVLVVAEVAAGSEPSIFWSGALVVPLTDEIVSRPASRSSVRGAYIIS
jgi:hypothetical protein